MVLVTLSCEGNVMSAVFVEEVLTVSADAYIDVNYNSGETVDG